MCTIRFGLETEAPETSWSDRASVDASNPDGRNSFLWELMAMAATFVLLATASTALTTLPWDEAKHAIEDRPVAEQFALLR
jgi:hypothetical protein